MELSTIVLYAICGLAIAIFIVAAMLYPVKEQPTQKRERQPPHGGPHIGGTPPFSSPNSSAGVKMARGYGPYKYMGSRGYMRGRR